MREDKEETIKATIDKRYVARKTFDGSCLDAGRARTNTKPTAARTRRTYPHDPTRSGDGLGIEDGENTPIALAREIHSEGLAQKYHRDPARMTDQIATSTRFLQ